MTHLSDPELGTMTHGRNIDRTPSTSLYKWVECYNLERKIGCGSRRWALYGGPSKGKSLYRLCPECRRRGANIWMNTWLNTVVPERDVE
jgi:hypothetical protein